LHWAALLNLRGTVFFISHQRAPSPVETAPANTWRKFRRVIAILRKFFLNNPDSSPG